MPNPKSPRLTPTVWIIVAFTLIYLSIAIISALRGGNREFLIYIAVMAVLIALVGYVHFRVHLTTATLWALSIWGLLHMIGGLVHVPDSWPIQGESTVVYNWMLIPGFLKYDQAVHAFGFAVTTWVCWQGLRSILRPLGVNRPSFGMMVLCAAAGMGFGALNEVIEFTATLLVETNVGGYTNTGWDLVSNMTGAIIAAALIYINEHNKV